MNEVNAREVVDRLLAERQAESAKVAAEREAADRAVHAELSVLEQYASLTEALGSARERYELAIARMDSASKPFTVTDAARNILNATDQLPNIIQKLATADCLSKRRADLLKEIRKQTIEAAQARLEDFQKQNADVLRKHGIVG